MIIYNMTVIMGENNSSHAPTIKCNDTGVRLRIFPVIRTPLSKFRDKLEAYTIPAGCTAVLKVAKPDGTYTLTDGKIKDNSMCFKLPPQACTALGEAKAEANIYGADGRRVTTGTFILDIKKEAVSDHSPDSQVYVDILADYIQAVNTAKDEAIDAAERAEAAAEATGGAGTGGAGSSGDAVKIDKTLTLEGAAADAKETGDRLSKKAEVFTVTLEIEVNEDGSLKGNNPTATFDEMQGAYKKGQIVCCVGHVAMTGETYVLNLYSFDKEKICFISAYIKGGAIYVSCNPENGWYTAVWNNYDIAEIDSMFKGVESQMGDVSTALDNIIAIQETHTIPGVNVATEDGDSV